MINRTQKLAILIVLLLLSSIGFAQTKNLVTKSELQHFKEAHDKRSSLLKQEIDSLKSINKSLRHELTQLKDSIAISIEQVQSRIDDKHLEKELSIAESTLKKQNYLLDGFATFYTYITILIGLLTLGLPLLVWIFGIRPAKKALSKAKTKFKDHLKEYRIEQINESIDNLKAKNKEIVTLAVNYILSLVPKYKFAEDQLYRMYIISKYENIDTTSREHLSYILSTHDYPFCKDYFFDILKQKVSEISDHPIKNHAFNYLMEFHKSKTYVLSRLLELVLNTKNVGKSFSVVLGWCIPDNSDVFWKLINYEVLIEKLNTDALQTVYQAFEQRSDILESNSLANLSESQRLEKYQTKFMKSELVKKLKKNKLIT